MILLFFSFPILFLIEILFLALSYLKAMRIDGIVFHLVCFYESSLACHVYSINKWADGKKKEKGREREKKASSLANKSSLENDKFINAFCKITYRTQFTYIACMCGHSGSCTYILYIYMHAFSRIRHKQACLVRLTSIQIKHLKRRQD